MIYSQDAIKAINQAVADRGYLAGWSDESIAARNIVKLGEEFGELAELFELPKIAGQEIDRVRMICQQTFESRAIWTDEFKPDPARLAEIEKEIADVVVVVMVLSAAIARITGKPFDPLLMAYKKATADVERGTRYSTGPGGRIE